MVGCRANFCGSLDHALGSENFRLPDRRGRLNVDNDRWAQPVGATL
jgi:hypothetical protein